MRLTGRLQSETLRPDTTMVWGVTMRIMAAILAAVVFGGLSLDVASAQENSSGRPRVRIYRNDDPRGVYPRYNPGPDAVRDCTAQLVQEHRPSGTVIVPHMNCYWRRG